jgi:hypothetical protein
VNSESFYLKGFLFAGRRNPLEIETFYLADLYATSVKVSHRDPYPEILLTRFSLAWKTSRSIVLRKSRRSVYACKYLANVGSVRQSRDRNPRACYTIFDTDNNGWNSDYEPDSYGNFNPQDQNTRRAADRRHRLIIRKPAACLRAAH